MLRSCSREASSEAVQEGVAQRVACLQLFKHEALAMPLAIRAKACKRVGQEQ